MIRKMKNKSGFTLIELLAVIVILGILMIIAIPQVTKYIENSKKDTYADTAKAYINSARYMLLNDEFTETSCTLPPSGESITIALSAIYLEQGGVKSPYNKSIDTENSYVKVTKNSNAEKYQYWIYIVDKQGNGTNGLKKETSLTRSAIVKRIAAQGENSKPDPKPCATKLPNGEINQDEDDEE